MLGLTAGGCGGSGAKLIPVSGKVTVGTQPLDMGSVSYKPDAAKGNTGKAEPSGIIDGSGTYTLMTEGKKGAPAGWYKVTVVAEETGDSTNPVVKSKVNPKFKDPQTSNLSVEVKDGTAAGAYDLKVTK